MDTVQIDRSWHIGEWVHLQSINEPNKLAVVDGDTRLSYQDLSRIVSNISYRLSQANIGEGSCVAILLPNSWQMVATTLAILQCGAIVLPLNPLYLDSEIESIISDAKPEAIFASNNKLSIISPLIHKQDGQKQPQLCVTDISGIPDWICFDDLINQQATYESKVRSLAAEPDQLSALWLYSSGSTGGSKKISRSVANLIEEAKALHDALRTNANDVFLCAVPVAHAHGFGNALIAAFYVGATLVLHEKFDRRRFLTSIEAEKVSIVPGSPFMYKVAAETKMNPEPDLSSIRYWLSAGAPLAEQTFNQCWERFRIGIRQLYGTTETGAISVNTAKNITDTWQTVGAPLGDTEVVIFNENDYILPNNIEGRIGVKSPTMFAQYEVAKLNEDAFSKGYFFPGDIGYKLDSGTVVVSGRETKFINVAGNKVDPAEVEAIIQSHTKVSEVIVIGKQDEHTEVVKAFIVADGTCSAEEILEHCQGKIAEYKIPKMIEFIDALPKNPLGKVLKKYLR